MTVTYNRCQKMAILIKSCRKQIIDFLTAEIFNSHNKNLPMYKSSRLGQSLKFYLKLLFERILEFNKLILFQSQFFDARGGNNKTPSGFIEYRLKTLRLGLDKTLKKNKPRMQTKLLEGDDKDKRDDREERDHEDEPDDEDADLKKLVIFFSYNARNISLDFDYSTIYMDFF